MDKDPRKAATLAKGSARAGTGGASRAMNRIQARRERKLALQQDVLEITRQAPFLGFS
jgi:hypothetical protein